MAGEEIFASFGNIGGSVVTIVLWLVVLGIVLGGGYIAYTFGVFTRRPYKVHIFLPRAGGAFKLTTLPGRYLGIKKGTQDQTQFEIKYAWNDLAVVDAPKEDYIHEGNILYGISPTKGNVHWIKEFEAANATLEMKTELPESAQLTFAVAHDIGYQRTHQQNQWMQVFPAIMFLIGAIIIGGSLWLAGHEQAQATTAYQSALSAFSSHLENSTIYVYKDMPKDSLPQGAPQGTTTRPLG